MMKVLFCLLVVLVLALCSPVAAIEITRFPPTGPAANDEFEVTLRITGELPLVVGIVETIPGGFEIPEEEDERPFVNVSGQKIAFGAINETEIKYRVKASSSGEGTFSGTWIDMLSENEGSIADTIVMVGGGGAGAIEAPAVTPTPTPFVPAVTKATRSIPVMEAGKEVAIVFKDMDVSLIALKADKNVSDVKVKVERVERTPDIPAPSGIAYAYLDIKVENAEGAKVEGKVELKVGKSWISANNIDEATVTLNRYDRGEWKALPTSKIGGDNATVYFEAETPGFSLFGVTGEKKEEMVTAATPTPAVIPAATPSPTTTASPTPASKVPGFEAIFAVVSSFIVYTMVFRKKGKRGDVK